MQAPLAARLKGAIKNVIRSYLVPWRRSIHIYRGAGIGDVLMCTPGIRKLKEKNSKCKVYFYTDCPDLVKGLWYIDEVLPPKMRPPKWITMSYEGSRIGRKHLSKIMAARIGVKLEDVRPDCMPDANLVRQLKAEWAHLPRPHILVQRRAGQWTPNKNWPDQFWKVLIDKLLTNYSIIEIGASSDDSVISNPHYLDLRGKTDIAHLIAAVAAGDVLIAPDSGPVHIAAGVKTPSVVIMGGYILSENVFYPGNVMLDTAIPCSPCWLQTPCPINLECLRRISPEDVVKAVVGILNVKSIGPTPVDPTS